MLTLSEAAVISSSMEALLFGFSLLMFILTLWILLRRREHRRPNYFLIIAACVLESLAFAELINNIVRTWKGVLTEGPEFPGGPERYLSYLKNPTFIAKSILYNTQTLILDGVLIYRTYMVWRTVYVIILPTLGWLALLATTIGLNTSLLTVKGEVNRFDMFAGATGNWITSVYSLTLATNLLTSVLLAYKVWKVDRDARGYKAGNFLAPVVMAIIESGAIYSATVTAALICFAVNSPGTYVILDMISPIICIVFNMIIIRIAFASRKMLPSILGTSRNQGTTTIDEEREHRSRHRGGSIKTGFRNYPSDNYQLTSLAVEVTRYVETDADPDVDTEDNKVVRMDDDSNDAITISEAKRSHQVV